MRCVVFGGTGYIGGRLVPELLHNGYNVCVVARHPEKLRETPWASLVEVVQGDVTDADSIRTVLAPGDVIYYLVHSLNRSDFVSLDREAARNVARAAEEANAKRIIYLGGIMPEGNDFSAHLASRNEVGRTFVDSGVPTTVLQAAVIIGSGSASFEMLRYLTERLPAMITPRWVHNRIQPIAVRDVLHYLVASAVSPARGSHVFDIGGPEVLSYLDMMRRYARIAGLRRRIIVPVPLLSPWLSAQWVNLVTPVPRSIAVPLIESLVHELVCRQGEVSAHIPPPEAGLTSYEDAVRLALDKIRALDVASRWSDAAWPQAPSDPLPTDPQWSGGSIYEDVRQRQTTADPQVLWEVIESIGGESGWYSFPLAWSVRGWADRVVGGVGLRRGRRHPHRLTVGEALDWWRVESLERGRLLRLRAEMKLPGRAWLELSVETAEGADTVYRQRAIFEPRGFGGHFYWKAVSPFHGIVFGGMLRNITSAAEESP
ncbi:SDR family oxidoreductase [Natronoglycomyces albus]